MENDNLLDIILNFIDDDKREVSAEVLGKYGHSNIQDSKLKNAIEKLHEDGYINEPKKIKKYAFWISINENGKIFRHQGGYKQYHVNKLERDSLEIDQMKSNIKYNRINNRYFIANIIFTVINIILFIVSIINN